MTRLGRDELAHGFAGQQSPESIEQEPGDCGEHDSSAPDAASHPHAEELRPQDCAYYFGPPGLGFEAVACGRMISEIRSGLDLSRTTCGYFSPSW